jgi:hypothetical protein
MPFAPLPDLVQATAGAFPTFIPLNPNALGASLESTPKHCRRQTFNLPRGSRASPHSLTAPTDTSFARRLPLPVPRFGTRAGIPWTVAIGHVSVTGGGACEWSPCLAQTGQILLRIRNDRQKAEAEMDTHTRNAGPRSVCGALARAVVAGGLRMPVSLLPRPTASPFSS